MITNLQYTRATLVLSSPLNKKKIANAITIEKGAFSWSQSEPPILQTWENCCCCRPSGRGQVTEFKPLQRGVDRVAGCSNKLLNLKTVHLKNFSIQTQVFYIILLTDYIQIRSF